MPRVAAILTLLAGSCVLTGAVQAQTSPLGMLDRLKRGGWELTFRDSGDTAKICLADGRELIQLRHARLKCNRIVVDDTPHEVTVQYSCSGNGYGRTHIRRETDQLVQIDTQGIDGGLPFSFAAEARWSGSCGRR